MITKKYKNVARVIIDKLALLVVVVIFFGFLFVFFIGLPNRCYYKLSDVRVCYPIFPPQFWLHPEWEFEIFKLI